MMAGGRAQHMWRSEIPAGIGDEVDGPMIHSHLEMLDGLEPGHDWRKELERETDDLLAAHWRAVEALALHEDVQERAPDPAIPGPTMPVA